MLSGGERNRVLLAKLFSKSANLLVLDEPTNDLDIETLELLEELLAEYDGTVFLVSHDRRFLDNVVTSTIAYEGTPENPGFWREYEGGVTDWITQSKRAAQLTGGNKAAAAAAVSPSSAAYVAAAAPEDTASSIIFGDGSPVMIPTGLLSQICSARFKPLIPCIPGMFQSSKTTSNFSSPCSRTTASSKVLTVET